MQCMYLCCFHLDILSIRTLPSHVEHPRNSAAKGLFPCRSGTKINSRMLSKTFCSTEPQTKAHLVGLETFTAWKNCKGCDCNRKVFRCKGSIRIHQPTKVRVANGREVGLLSWIPCLTFEIHLWLLSCTRENMTSHHGRMDLVWIFETPSGLDVLYSDNYSKILWYYFDNLSFDSCTSTPNRERIDGDRHSQKVA